MSSFSKFIAQSAIADGPVLLQCQSQTAEGYCSTQSRVRALELLIWKVPVPGICLKLIWGPCTYTGGSTYGHVLKG
jgi:hypothetical protein